jgi:hypothetical protein
LNGQTAVGGRYEKSVSMKVIKGLVEHFGPPAGDSRDSANLVTTDGHGGQRREDDPAAHLPDRHARLRRHGHHAALNWR